MPRTASTTKTDRIAPRTSTKFREERVTDQVPVLFRLPLVDCLPVPSVAGEPMFATAELQPEWAPTPVVAPTLPTQPPQPIQPPQSKPAAPVVSSSTTEVEPVHVQPAATVQPFAATSHPSLKIDTDAERSWWEHWSSGVVLILLIIALVTASILAFNDSGSIDPSLLAELGDKPIETLDLNIPELTPPQVTPSNATTEKRQTTTPPNGGTLLSANRTNRDMPAADRAAPASSSLLPSDLIPSELVFESKATGPDLSLGSNQPATAAPTAATNSQPNLRPLASLVAGQAVSSPTTREAPAGAELLAPSSPSTATTSPLASATLTPPIGMELPPLFSNDELSFGDAPSSSPILSSQTASLPAAAQQASMQQTSGDASAASNFSHGGSSSRNSAAGSSTAAQSPALTDGALTLPSGLLEQPTLSSIGSSSLSNTHSPVETNLPSYQALLVGSLTSASGSQASLIPDEGATAAAPVATTSDAPAMTGVPATETPELSTEAIIRAWQMHKAVNQAQTSPSNRYVAPNATNPGGTMSYTLGGATSTANPPVPGASGTETAPPANPTLPRF